MIILLFLMPSAVGLKVYPSLCPVFKDLVDILDCTKWPTDVTQLLSYGDSNMTELIKHLHRY
jgi:hypothetical protein